MIPTNKRTQYEALVSDRKTCDLCSHRLNNAAAIHGGRFDCDEISPFSRWQGNLDAELMVVGRDFADEERFIDCKGWPDEQAGTNLALVELAQEAGIAIQRPKCGVSDDRLFFTNGVLCMNRDKDRPIPNRCFDACGRMFLRPLVEIVRPKLLVSLGVQTARAVRSAFADARVPEPLACPALDPIRLNAATCWMALCHPSRRVLNSMRSLEEQRGDWRKVGRVLASLRSSGAVSADSTPKAPAA